MTTISSRLTRLEEVLNSLLSQTTSATSIALNISVSPYMLDQGIRFENLPRKIRELAILGKIHVYFCPNTGPYRKIVPFIDRFTDIEYLVATADDDVLYPPEWLEELVNYSTKYDCVAAYRCRQMAISGKAFTPYNTWPLLATPEHRESQSVKAYLPSRLIFPTGRDGIIYHSRHLKDREALQAFQLLAPGQDDIALKFLTLLAGSPTVRIPRERTSFPDGPDFPSVRGISTSLWATNLIEKNDKAVASILKWCREHRTRDLIQEIHDGAA